jgi:hypothetical protein
MSKAGRTASIMRLALQSQDALARMQDAADRVGDDAAWLAAKRAEAELAEWLSKEAAGPSHGSDAGTARRDASPVSGR